MDSFLDTAIAPSSLVAVAAILHTTAYLFQSPIVMRSLLLVGTFLYISYYFVAASEPLWAAIYGTGAIAVSSFFGFIVLLVGQTKWIIPSRHRALIAHFPDVEPRVFRNLMKAATVRVVTEDEILTRRDQTPDRLFYILTGQVTVEKNGAIFHVPAMNFIGEISMLLGSDVKASAEVLAPAGCAIIEWQREKLRKLARKDIRLRITLEALFARDMAAKLALSRA